jgi:RimJ/RimL family protein N-acetyltransferase
MSDDVYIRPLELRDALVSWRWRNNPKLWKYTGAAPDRVITPEIETAWLAGVLQRPDEKRFAVCLREEDRYIGNIYLTGIGEEAAHIHIFIGEVECWGKGRAYNAACLLLDYAFGILGLKLIQAQIDPGNASSLALGRLMGFINTGVKGKYVELFFTSAMYKNKEHAGQGRGSD